MNVLFVGEAPSRRRSTDLPAFSTVGPSGRRLAALLGTESVLSVASTVNLIERHLDPGARWPAAEAEARAILLTVYRREPRFVLFGRRVAKAFGHDDDWFVWRQRDGKLIAACPHPSGLSHYWNDDENVERARRFLRETIDDRVWVPA